MLALYMVIQSLTVECIESWNVSVLIKAGIEKFDIVRIENLLQNAHHDLGISLPDLETQFL